MATKDRLKRVTDLFVEGEVLPLGLEEDGTPIVIWVQKPNSFDVEEARRDGMAARADLILSLKNPLNPETQVAYEQLDKWDKAEIIEQRIAQEGDQFMLTAMSDIESDKEWRENLDYMRRMPTLLQDGSIDEDDDRHKRLAELNDRYREEIKTRGEQQREKRRRELKDESLDDLREAFLSHWRDRVSLDFYMKEKRVTELFFSLRDCRAVRNEDSREWDHAKCDHTIRLYEKRAEVRDAPDGLLTAAIDILDDLEIGQRESGNSAAPMSSSASSESPSEAEESTPSTPKETSDGVTTT